MKKQVLSVFFALCLIFTLLPVSALADTTSNKCGDNLTWALSYSGTLTISGTGAMNSYSSSKNTDGDYVTTAPWGKYYRLINRVVIGNGVTNIGGSAFQGCSSLTSVTIPDTVTWVDWFAFQDCIGLTSVTLPDSVTSIGWSAFQGCIGLTSVTLPDCITGIGDWVFCNCSSLTSITIPETVTSIGYKSFEGCNSLTSVTIPDNVTSIGSCAFDGCSGLTSVTIPDSVASLGNYTFIGCSGLTSVTIGNGVTSIGDDAFFGCSSIKDVYYTGYVSSWLGISFSDHDSNPCRYGANLYFNGKLVTNVVIPDSVTSIGSDAFYGCTSLTSVTMPDSVTSIGDSAFFGCSNLSSVTIPVSVTSIGEQAFEGCSNFKEVYYSASIGEWTAISIGSSNDSLTNAKLHCTDGNLIYYGKCDDSHIWTLDESGTLTISGEGAMSNYSTSKNTDGYFVTTAPWRKCYRLINRVVIDDGVTSIGERAFYGCNSLTSVTIPDGVTSIGSNAFSGCSSLASVTIPDSVTSIGECAFHECSKLKDAAYGGTKEGWEATGYTFPSYVRMHYSCTSLEGHFVPMEVKETSCESAGYISYGCACGHEYKVMIPQNHNYVFSKTVAPTCSEHGYDLFVCSKCGAEKKEYHDDELLQHSYVVSAVEPSCLVGGYKLHKCSVCGDSYKDELVQPLGHSETNAEAKAPTCTEAGHTAGTCCSRCGKIMSGMAEIAALGHSYKNGVCTRCGEKDPNYVAAPVIKITTSAGKPKLTWNKVEGATKYYIYRSTDGKNYKQYTSTTKTSYTNTSTTIGTTYYYKVKAAKVVNGKNVYSVYSNVKSVKCVPAAPVVSISRSNGKPKLTWKAVTGADKYYIYRSTDGKTYKQYTSTSKTSYINSGASSGTKYYYKVTAVAVINDEEVESGTNAAKSMITTLKKPTVKITTANGKPKLTWNAVTGANKYEIYRSIDGVNYNLLYTTTSTAFTNTGAKKNTKYYYKVKAICSANSNANSTFSNIVSIKATK